MRKAIDFTSWEVGFARGQVTHAMVAGLVLLTVLGTLAVLAVASVLGEDVFHRGFWFFLPTIVLPLIAAWFKILAELVHLRYRWETGQDREED